MEVNDLRSSIELLKQMNHQLVETDIEVDPAAERKNLASCFVTLRFIRLNWS